MAHYGTLKDYHFTTETADDVRGSSIYGMNDDKLGKIDDVIFDHTTGAIRYVVVDTGGWLKSRKFIVPADRLQPSPEHENDYVVNLTKNQIESFPLYDENAVESQERWGDYENRYQSAWTDSPVQHRVGSEKNVTPSVVPPRGTSNLGRRWTAFEGRLRRERDVIVGHCSACTTGRERKVS